MKSIYTMVGMQYRKSNKLLASLKKGARLELRRDPHNPVDSNAVEVWYGDKHVAFIKATQAVALAKRMDDSLRTTINARLMFFDDDHWPEVEVEL